MKRHVVLLVMLSLAAQVAVAQGVRGSIVESVSRRAIPGAVITVLDAAGGVLSRDISDQRGTFAVTLSARAARVRVVRIGFRPRDLPVAPSMADGGQLRVAMMMLPTMLEPARVDAKQCPKRADAQQALGLWEQVRAGLLATIVTREKKPGTMVLMGYAQVNQGLTSAITRFEVKKDSNAYAINTYKAVRDAREFVRLGFSTMQEDGLVYYAPDAEVLLDDGFASGYCFRLVRPTPERANQVGLGFASPDRRRGRVDIEGTLWVDTTARSIKDIDFRYLGIHDRVDPLSPGGNIAFREMPNGASFIDRWHIRMIATRTDTTGRRARDNAPILGTSFYAVTNGGELAHARWLDSTTYDSDLGRLRLTARTPSGAAAGGVHVALIDTPFEKVLDHTGVFEVNDLLPGPYALVVREPRLAQIRMDSIPTQVRFTARRGATNLLAATLPTLEEWVLAHCGALKAPGATNGTLVLARVLDDAGKPVGGVRWSVRQPSGAITTSTEQQVIPTQSSGTTGSDGLIPLCTNSRLRQGAEVEFLLRKPGGRESSSKAAISNDVQLTLVPLTYVSVENP
jgi:hypothetical protein